MCATDFNEDNNPLNDLGTPSGSGGGGIWQAFTRMPKYAADRYNYSLDHNSNIVPLQGRRGRHTNVYHDFVAIAVTELDTIAAGSIDTFIQGMEILGKFIQANWWLPYAQYK